MNREGWLCAIGGTVLIFCLSAAAQEGGIWRAASSTAQSITGDVTLSEEKISIDYSSFPMARIRDLASGEVNAVFETDSSTGRPGSLYRLNIPASKKFLRRNTLCGSDDVQWMAAYGDGRTLHLAFFSGQKAPVLTPEALANSTDLCGTFLYER
jgi:hypothetical protein